MSQAQMSTQTMKRAPMGPHELAEFLGVKRATVQQWSFREVLPARDYTVGGFPAWELETVIAWAVETGRLKEDDPRAEGYLRTGEVPPFDSKAAAG